MTFIKLSSYEHYGRPIAILLEQITSISARMDGETPYTHITHGRQFTTVTETFDEIMEILSATQNY